MTKFNIGAKTSDLTFDFFIESARLPIYAAQRITGNHYRHALDNVAIPAAVVALPVAFAAGIAVTPLQPFINVSVMAFNAFNNHPSPIVTAPPLTTHPVTSSLSKPETQSTDSQAYEQISWLERSTNGTTWKVKENYYSSTLTPIVTSLTPKQDEVSIFTESSSSEESSWRQRGEKGKHSDTKIRKTESYAARHAEKSNGWEIS
jgi:hypothetical protein